MQHRLTSLQEKGMMDTIIPAQMMQEAPACLHHQSQEVKEQHNGEDTTAETIRTGEEAEEAEAEQEEEAGEKNEENWENWDRDTNYREWQQQEDQIFPQGRRGEGRNRGSTPQVGDSDFNETTPFQPPRGEQDLS
eukprot:12147520-Karenia_brevis.AAC.1